MVPPAAIQSATRKESEGDYSAENAIDRLYNTQSWAVPGSYDRAWLEISLDMIYCILRVIWYNSDTSFASAWKCSSTEEKCENSPDTSHTLTVYSKDEETAGNFPGARGCKTGDSLRFEQADDKHIFAVNEVSTIAKSGMLETIESQFLTPIH